MPDHANLVAPASVHPAAYVQSTDPGAVGAHKFWVDTSTGAGTLVSPYTMKKRNALNTAWEFISGGGVTGLTGPIGITGAQGPPGPATGVPYINIQDRKPQNTAGGTFTSGSPQTRTLNTVQVDSNGLLVSLSSNQFTLPAGKWRYHILAPAYAVDRHQARLQNITDSTTVDVSMSMASGAADTTVSVAEITGVMILLSNKTFEVQHQCSTTGTTTGFGIAANFFSAGEVYTVVQLWRDDSSPPIGAQHASTLPPVYLRNPRDARFFGTTNHANTTAPV